MPDVTVERRSAPRHAMVLAADVVEHPRGARRSARRSDISLNGCHIDTLNPTPMGSEVRLRISHNDEILERVGRVVYVSYRLGWAWCSRRWRKTRKPAWSGGWQIAIRNSDQDIAGSPCHSEARICREGEVN
jgi:hypothetical protein